jgi:hypothetical protein
MLDENRLEKALRFLETSPETRPRMIRYGELLADRFGSHDAVTEIIGKHGLHDRIRLAVLNLQHERFDL